MIVEAIIGGVTAITLGAFWLTERVVAKTPCDIDPDTGQESV